MSMSKPHIFYASDLNRAEQWRAALATQFETFDFSTVDDLRTPESVDVALLWRIPEGGLKRFTGLRAVLSLGAGVNQIDLNQLPAGVPLAKLVDTTLTRMMVEYAKATVYRYHRRLHLFEQHSRDARWEMEFPKPNSQTALAVLGLGTLGLAVAVALREEGFVVGAWSRTDKSVDGVRTCAGPAELYSLLADSEIIVNLLPLTTATRHLFDHRLFVRFRPGSKLINLGRGEHIVDADLLEAIANGRVEAATLDVTHPEPLPQGHPFWNHPAILVTPHIAALSSPMTAVVSLAENIRRALAGAPLLNAVDIQYGY